jgi:hypothetical protein
VMVSTLVIIVVGIISRTDSDLFRNGVKNRVMNVGNR